jgi:hypothetical protein
MASLSCPERIVDSFERCGRGYCTTRPVTVRSGETLVLRHGPLYIRHHLEVCLNGVFSANTHVNAQGALWFANSGSHITTPRWVVLCAALASAAAYAGYLHAKSGARYN